MLDEKTLRRRVLLRLLGSPVTVVPFMLGMTAMASSWALDWKPAVGLFAGLTGALCAAGAFVTRLLLSGDRVARDAAAELDREDYQRRERALDELDQRLCSADKDARPEAALRDLRALVKALEEQTADSSGFNAGAVVDIRSRVGQLFDHCVESLRQTDRLWQTAQQLHTAAARKPILEQRERTIDDIQASIKQLSDTLVALQSLGASDRSQATLARLRDELDQSLAIAKTVEERVNNLVKEAAVEAHEQPFKPKE